MTDRLTPKVPKVLSHYRIGPLLGQGGMGMVFEATDRRDRSRVALKLLHAHLAQDRNFQDRFKREAHVAALLRSPYTVHLLDYGFAQDHYFLVMEYIDGRTMKDELEKGVMEPARALGICVQVARALEEAQARGVVHRDIKPENVMLQAGDSVKVTDFGIARQLSGGTLTMTGGFLGTMAYAAPEQAMGRSDHRSDLYSLGATLYNALAGRPPYLGGVMEVLGQADLAFPETPLKEHDIPEEIVEITRKALQRDPDKRYNSASEMAGAMDRAQNSVGTQPMSSATVIAPGAAGAAATAAVAGDDEATQLVTPTDGDDTDEATQMASAATAVGAGEDVTGDATEVAAAPPVAAAATPAPAADPFASREASRPAPSTERQEEWTAQPTRSGIPPLAIGGAILAVLAAVGIGAFVLTSGGGGDDGGGGDGAPENDSFGDARAISSLPFSDDLDTSAATAASDEAASGCGGDDPAATVWYQYEAEDDGAVSISTEGSDYDTVVGIFTGEEDDLDEEACDDDGGTQPSFTSRASFATEEGETYFIVVAGDDEGGQLEIVVTDALDDVTPTTEETETPEETTTPIETATPVTGGPAPANDLIEDAAVAVSLPFSDSLDTTGATTSADDPSATTLCGGVSEPLRTVWYMIDQRTDLVTIPISISTTGSDFDTVVAVYDATDGPLTALKCSDDVAAGNPISFLSFTAEAERLYFVQVGAFGDAGTGGNLELSFDVQSIDDIAAPADVGHVPFNITLDVSTASTSPDDPVVSCGGQQHTGSVWFLVFTPTFSGRLFVDTDGSDYDTVVAVWTGERGALSEVTCNDDFVAGSLGPSRVEWDVVEGTSYYISVAAYGTGVPANLQLAIDFVP